MNPETRMPKRAFGSHRAFVFLFVLGAFCRHLSVCYFAYAVHKRL